MAAGALIEGDQALGVESEREEIISKDTDRF